MEQLLNGHWVTEWGEGYTVVFPREIRDAKQVTELPWGKLARSEEAAFFTFRLDPPIRRLAYDKINLLEFALVHLRSKDLLDDLPLIGCILYAFEKESDRGKGADIPRDGFSMSYKVCLYRSYAEAEAHFKEELLSLHSLVAKALP